MSADDLPLHVETRGEGPPLVLLHGFGASRFTWRHWEPALARRHRLHLVDLKGCGSAPKPLDGNYSPVEQAELVTRLIRDRGLGDVTLLGHSLGGGIALLVTLRLMDAGEDRVRRLLLVAATAYPQALPRYIGLASRLPRTLLRLGARWGDARGLIRRILEEIVHDPSVVTQEMVEGYAAPYRDPSCRYAVIEAARSILPPDLDRIQQRYPGVEVPTLLLWGEQDPVVPRWVGERLEAELPRARLETVEACGHLPMEERPEASLEKILTFMDGGAPG